MKINMWHVDNLWKAGGEKLSLLEILSPVYHYQEVWVVSCVPVPSSGLSRYSAGYYPPCVIDGTTFLRRDMPNSYEWKEFI